MLFVKKNKKKLLITKKKNSTAFKDLLQSVTDVNQRTKEKDKLFIALFASDAWIKIKLYSIYSLCLYNLQFKLKAVIFLKA